jgi:hypothetical protein
VVGEGLAQGLLEEARERDPVVRPAHQAAGDRCRGFGSRPGRQSLGDSGRDRCRLGHQSSPSLKSREESRSK